MICLPKENYWFPDKLFYNNRKNHASFTLVSWFCWLIEEYQVQPKELLQISHWYHLYRFCPDPSYCFTEINFNQQPSASLVILFSISGNICLQYTLSGDIFQFFVPLSDPVKFKNSNIDFLLYRYDYLEFRNTGNSFPTYKCAWTFPYTLETLLWFKKGQWENIFRSL